MDIEEISQTLYKEKSQTLKAIPADFYREAGKYVRELEEDIAKINNPRSPESKMLNDELERAYSDLETIFMKRIGKIITRATNQSHADKPISKDIEKLLPAEKRLYDLVLEGIKAAKKELLEPIMYPGAAAEPASWPQPRGEIDRNLSPEGAVAAAGMAAGTVSGTSAGTATVAATGTGAGAGGNAGMGAAGEKKGASGTARDKNNINEEYVVVRILKDLPTFTGADGRNYTVSAEDVVVLPQLNATGLIKRKAAKLIAGQAAGEAP